MYYNFIRFIQHIVILYNVAYLCKSYVDILEYCQIDSNNYKAIGLIETFCIKH